MHEAAQELLPLFESAGKLEVTATADTEDGKRRLVAWGFMEADGMWTWGTRR